MTFAPVLTFRLRRLEKTTFSVCTFAVTMLAEAMLARVEMVAYPILALVEMTFVVETAFDA